MMNQNSISIISIDTVKIAADSIGIAGISDDVAILLCQEVEYRIREMIQESVKFMKHSKRERLTTGDINNALRLRNVDILYGYGSKDLLYFVKVNGCKDLFFVEDKEVDLETVITQSKVAPLPYQVSYGVHWLAVEGAQPDIPQNPPKSKRPASVIREEAKTENLILEDVEVKPAVRHVLSKELQELYEKLTDIILRRDSSAYSAALSALACEPGLHQLLPYFCQFITKQITENLQSLPTLHSMMRMMYSILTNVNIHVDHYLHQLIPAVLTCLVGKRLCESPTEDHWALRDQAAELVAYICNRWGREYATILPRIVKTLSRAFFDVKRPLTSHYGAIVGLDKLGPQTRHLIILPNLDRYFVYLEPAMEQSESTVKRVEANMCYQALLAACGQYLYDSAKIYENSEKPLLEFSTVDLRSVPKEAKEDPSDKPPSPSNLDWALKAIRLQKSLLPISQQYCRLYKIFGESIFPYITCRWDDFASTLIL